MNDNIKTFPGAAPDGLPENPIQIAPRRPGWCQHGRIMLDEHTRTVQCIEKDCGATLDAFDYLRSNARGIQAAWETHRRVRDEASTIAERVTALKKEEARLRAMVKRLQEKSGAVLQVRGKELL